MDISEQHQHLEVDVSPESTGTTGPNEASPLTTATCVDGDNNQTWLQPLIDRTNAVNEETARIKAETARLKKEVAS